MKVFLTTTGTQSPVVLPDMGGREFTHPTSNFELTLEFPINEIETSLDIQDALDNGYITLAGYSINICLYSWKFI